MRTATKLPGRVACLLLTALATAVGAHAAAEAQAGPAWEPEDWACSPANTRNPNCPAHLSGDARCTVEFCPALAGCATADCNPLQGNVQESKLLALDAYAVKGDGCIRQDFSVSECCSLCKQTRGCNAWSYCNAPDGCGDACDPHQHAFSWFTLPQPWNDVDPLSHPHRLNPIHACTVDGGFPQGTCSLKVLAQDALAAPPLQSGNQTGWVSGVVAPGASAGVDTVAFVLEGDAARAGNTAGGLLEEDRTGSPAAVDASAPDITVPVNAGPKASRNAAVAAPGGGWRAALGACAAAWALFALGSV